MVVAIFELLDYYLRLSNDVNYHSYLCLICKRCHFNDQTMYYKRYKLAAQRYLAVSVKENQGSLSEMTFWSQKGGFQCKIF